MIFWIWSVARWSIIEKQPNVIGAPTIIISCFVRNTIVVLVVGVDRARKGFALPT